MQAYTPPEQILISPVTSYYKGKAIRQQLAAAEQDAELKGLQIDLAKQEIKDAPSNRQMAKERAELERDNLKLQMADRIRAGEVRELQINADLLTPSLVSYSAEPDEDKALAKFNEDIKIKMQSMDEASREKYTKLAGEDHVFNHDEIMRTGASIEGFMRAKEDSPWAKINPKDFTRESVAAFSQTGNESDLVAAPKAPLVSMNMGGETAATKAYGGTVGARAGDRDDKAFATYADDANLDALELALARGARSGWGESIILDVRGALDTLGLAQFPEGAQQSEVVRSIGNVLALRMRNPDSGLGLTGNTSNRDLMFLKDSVAGIGRSEGGNRLLVKMAKKLNQFKRDIAGEQARIIVANGGAVPLTLDASLMGFANEYQMFTDSERKEIDSFANDVENKPADIADASNDDVLKLLGLSP